MSPLTFTKRYGTNPPCTVEFTFLSVAVCAVLCVAVCVGVCVCVGVSRQNRQSWPTRACTSETHDSACLAPALHKARTTSWALGSIQPARHVARQHPNCIRSGQHPSWGHAAGAWMMRQPKPSHALCRAPARIADTARSLSACFKLCVVGEDHKSLRDEAARHETRRELIQARAPCWQTRILPQRIDLERLHSRQFLLPGEYCAAVHGSVPVEGGRKPLFSTTSRTGANAHELECGSGTRGGVRGLIHNHRFGTDRRVTLSKCLPHGAKRGLP